MGLPTTIILVTLIVIANILNFFKQILKPVYQVLAGSRSPSILRTPEERFSSLHLVGYNFGPNYIEKMIPPLVDAGYRVIVPDFIGFGKSDKYTSPRNYTHELHTMVLRMLIEDLNLQDMVLVCQDWGGLTGLSVVKDCPGLFSSLVVMNTGLPDPILNFDSQGFSMQRLQKILPFTLWRSLVSLFGTCLPVQFIFQAGFRNQRGVDQEVLNGYTAPFPTSLYCGGLASWPLLVPFFKDDPVTCHMWEAKNCLKTWKKPVLVAFSDSDPITRGQEKVFHKLVPTADSVVIKGARHFLQETHGEEISKEIIKFLSNQKMTSL